MSRLGGPAAVVLWLSAISAAAGPPYQPTWPSLDSRPLPAWYDAAKVGIFIHWSMFSVPSIDGGWFWHEWRTDRDPYHVEYMRRNYRPNTTYQDLAPLLSAQLFDADRWADLFNRSGAKYVVLTAKHHNGFCMWPSRHAWNWNSVDTGPHRDVVGELAAAVRARTDLVFGLYYSLYEWYNPLYLADRAGNDTKYVTQKMLPELHDLVNTYRPEVLWSDGDWAAPSDYWRSKQFLAWLYNKSPVKDTVVTNDRWGNGTACKHGGFLTCRDKYNPGTKQQRKWEDAFTLDLQAWSYDRRSGLRQYITIEQLIATMMEVISCGGNVLINVGPTKDGVIMPIFEERLTQLGQWLAVNGEAVYESQPWRVQRDPLEAGVWYSQRGRRLHAAVLRWPPAGRLRLGAVRQLSSCRLLGYGPLKVLEDGATVVFPPLQHVSVQWAWVLDLGDVADHEG